MAKRLNQIARLRKTTGLTQAEFSKKYRIPLSTLARWEQGRTNPPEYVTFLLDKVINELDFKLQ